jgi:transposase
MPVGAATLLSFMRRFGGMALPTPRVLGVNDWSFQHDQPTGTILVDLERHQPVDLLLGNDEQVLDRWHFIVRRIGAYSIPFEERRG